MRTFMLLFIFQKGCQWNAGQGQSLSSLKQFCFRVRVRLGLGLGLVSTLNLNLTLKQHSLKKRIDPDPAFYWHPFNSPKTSLFPRINCCLCQTFLGNRWKRSSFSSKCHARQLGGNVVGFCFDDYSGVRTCEINHLGKKITQHSPS